MAVINACVNARHQYVQHLVNMDKKYLSTVTGVKHVKCKDPPAPVCPAVKSCSLGNCRIVRNQAGCNECKCQCPSQRCPNNCQHGNNVVLGDDGCQTCACNDPPACPTVRRCLGGCKIVANANGCNECKCCPILRCRSECESGYVKDRFNCRTCRCMEDDDDDEDGDTDEEEEEQDKRHKKKKHGKHGGHGKRGGPGKRDRHDGHNHDDRRGGRGKQGKRGKHGGPGGKRRGHHG